MRALLVSSLVMLLAVPAYTAPQHAAIGTDELRAADPNLGDAFGRRVAVSGNTILVGANADDERGPDAGAAYIFERDSAGAWNQKQKLLPPEIRDGDFFGWSVALQDDVAVVGAPGDDRDNTGTTSPASANRGAAYVFVRVNGTWVQWTRFQPSELAAGDEFGSRIAIHLPFVMVSAIYADTVAPWNAASMVSNAGRAWVFLNTPQGWTRDAVLSSPFPREGGRFGFSLALELGVAVVGEPTSSANTVYRFARPVRDWLPIAFGVSSSPATDGRAEAARFAYLRGIARWPGWLGRSAGRAGRFGSAGVVIRKVSPDGQVTTLFSVTASPFVANDALESDDTGTIYLASVNTLRKRLPDGSEPVIATGFNRC